MNPDTTVVITGGSGGIGAALAVALGEKGYRVAVAARRERELAEVARRSGDGSLAIVADVRRRGDVEQIYHRAIATFGHIDVWVNNAGRGISKRVLDLTDEDVDEMMTVNTKSALYGMQTVVPHFIERGKGHLINVSSFLARIPLASFRSAYSAAKAALNSLTANLRMDLQATHPDIHVSLVMPGVVTTEFKDHALGVAPVPSPPLDTVKTQSAEEVAMAMVRLIEQPVAEMYTNPVQSEIVRRYYDNVGDFEANLLRR
jgi:short-subunit dehydrogenase